MVLVHVKKVTPRVSYIFKHICRRILGIEVDLTSKIEAFIAYDGPKFSYGKQPLGKELYFQSVDLLFEHGLTTVPIQVMNWEETKCFFQVKHPNSALPFDIFAASFYLITRYEEYMPHVKDNLGRFPATESIAYNHDFLEDPVVDIWAFKFKNALIHKYAHLKFDKKKFRILPILSVSETFAYKNKGFLRSLGAIMRDLWRLRLDQLSDRIKVILGLKKDPLDTFDFIIGLQQRKKRQCRVLFGLGDYSNYEKNISYNSLQHRIIIKHIADYIDVGLKVSYHALSDLSTFAKEKLRIEGILNRKLDYALCSFFKIKLPEAYRNYIELEIEEDYSMGYSKYSGFRAGTCTPFMFYDLDYEVQTPLVIHSFCIAPLGKREDFNNEAAAKKQIQAYINKIKKVDGTFIPVFSNVLFSELHNQTFWRSIFELIWNTEDE
ncbi:hypothetical protein J8281_02085 [Aquimarina sp. U1-2]|uniref:DUF7033 domain-containing protein n=1 Tax=Aquimarina sp. U1-2 TaxID=2823141 RepID=UPI001AEC79E1|nr:hypothetical protein [Aquimarina sp. U1-2]MBP2830963.1 hypothetical protein [Aquimarina sp. U1-2]